MVTPETREADKGRKVHETDSTNSEGDLLCDKMEQQSGSDSEDECVLQRTNTVKAGRTDAEAEASAALNASNPGFRVKNTFIHVDEEGHFSRTESDQTAPGRTTSDPSGRKVALPRWPKRDVEPLPEAVGLTRRNLAKSKERSPWRGLRPGITLRRILRIQLL
ncbi:unnamed protein product [Effrenium voratum]|nr:unnamed protein product [Effrenium voratum]